MRHDASVSAAGDELRLDPRRAVFAPRPVAGTPFAMEPARITSYRDGPLLVRGPFRLEDQDGVALDAGRSTVALCRCGKSRQRPFCDGSHKVVRFRAPSGAEQRGG